MKINNKFSIHNSFVCVDDVTKRYEQHNYVIYNPLKDSVLERTDILYKTVKASTGVELTSDQLIKLTRYDVNELNEFVEELRGILYYAKNIKSKN